MFRVFDRATISFNQRYMLNESFKELDYAARKGIEILGKKIDEELLDAWFLYVVSLLKMVDFACKGVNYTGEFMNEQLRLARKSNYNRVKASIEFLIEVAKQVKIAKRLA